MKKIITVITTVLSIPISSLAYTVEVESFSTYEMAMGKTLTYTSCKSTSNKAGIELAKELIIETQVYTRSIDLPACQTAIKAYNTYTDQKLSNESVEEDYVLVIAQSALSQDHNALGKVSCGNKYVGFYTKICTIKVKN